MKRYLRRTAGSVSPSIHALVEHKLIRRVGEGEYVLLQKAVPHREKPDTHVAAKPNGTAHQPETQAVEEMIHG
jgi:hypothetical protein